MLLTGIGDVVHGLPLARDLKRADPGREVVWIAEPAPAQVVLHHPDVDRVVVFRKSEGLRGVMAVFEAFRGRSCDLTLNLMRYVKGVFPALATGAPVRVGLPPSKTRDGVRFFNTHHLAETPWCHTQDLFLRFRAPLGLDPDAPVEWRITFSDEERRARDAFFESLRGPGRPVAGVVLATANPSKDWPAARYPELVRRLHDEAGLTPLLIGGPSPVEARVAERIVRESGVPVENGLGDSVRAMMWMVDGVDVLVSPDTGPLHIAHALETPVVGLFGHTNPWRVGPWRRYHELMVDAYTEAGDAPDPSAYAPKHGRMDDVRVDQVLDKVALARRRYP